MISRIHGFMTAGICLTAMAVLLGCATGDVRFNHVADKGDMSRYNTVAIRVNNDVEHECPPGVAENLQAAAIQQMEETHPGVFAAVRTAPLGHEGELLVDVHITKYEEGSRFARAMLIGLGASQLFTKVDMKDSQSGALLGSGNLELVWAVGGRVGASKGIEDVVNQAGVKIADAIVAFKGGTEQVDKPRGRQNR